MRGTREMNQSRIRSVRSSRRITPVSEDERREHDRELGSEYPPPHPSPHQPDGEKGFRNSTVAAPGSRQSCTPLQPLSSSMAVEVNPSDIRKTVYGKSGGTVDRDMAEKWGRRDLLPIFRIYRNQP